MQKHPIRKKVNMFGRKEGSEGYKFIPAKCNEAMEDDAELERNILVIDPSYNRPELHLHPLQICQNEVIKFFNMNGIYQHLVHI